ncbi:hypothetical protein CEH05_15215 [Halobacillus halophilus]|uniref:Uncharacterized protein n=1 Tax=Halobacillus halophilus (strain ATCC 35676 / DSM 2266 / JCM 20832 / KCTC 3685 / LMG 17431 / NBRC 102448 / NCIMB 2269) TaxID=866895 RepID=I0JQJ1_HALH3|nr:hypothetical protein CEH05_15215 [Halobacillus halophilus]CCG46411.1 hypothetical protein HBHAL_4070 [Halobacillus halophilus DSM 2266]
MVVPKDRLLQEINDLIDCSFIYDELMKIEENQIVRKKYSVQSAFLNLPFIILQFFSGHFLKKPLFLERRVDGRNYLFI